MKHVTHPVTALLLLTLCSSQGWAAEPQDAVGHAKVPEPSPISPAKSIESGLLLEPPLDLSWYTRDKFIERSSSIGVDRIRKKWTTPVVKLPAHARAYASGLTEAEVKCYMQTAKRLFESGEAIPVSDVGLISTQEDVVREPMLNHICGFENEAVRVYLLVQTFSSGGDWGYFSIVQDMTVDPPIDYYGQIKETGIKFEGTSCYKCHSSGPLAIHPAREDLVLDAKLAAALSQHIADQPPSQFHFPRHSPRPETGKPMTLSACTSCHEEAGDRGPLYQVHSHPIRVMVDFGYMPPEERLSPEEIVELQVWLNDKE